MELREELPVTRRSKGTPAQVANWLRQNPGMWGRWPVPQQREAVYKQTNNINQDRIKSLPASEFEARTYDGSTWVRYTNGHDLPEMSEKYTHPLPVQQEDNHQVSKVGKVGDTVTELNGTVISNSGVRTLFGTSPLVIIELDDGPTVSFFRNNKDNQDRSVGSHVTITSAKVKSHTMWQGEPQTLLSSVKLA
jgi:hypothetical protein